MHDFLRKFLFPASATLASLLCAQTPVFQIAPSTSDSFDYIGNPGNSASLPERMDSAQLGGTARTLAQVDVHVLLVGLFGGETADIQVKLFSGFDSGSGIFTGEIWASDVLDNQTIGLTPTLYSFFPSTSDIVLPDILYYGVVLSDIQGSPFRAGPVLSPENATPSSEFGPAPSIPSSSYWVLNANNTTYTEAVSRSSSTAVTIYATDVIPEPGTLGVLGIGALLLGFLHRLRAPRA